MVLPGDRKARVACVVVDEARQQAWLRSAGADLPVDAIILEPLPDSVPECLAGDGFVSARFRPRYLQDRTLVLACGTSDFDPKQALGEQAYRAHVKFRLGLAPFVVGLEQFKS